MNWASRRPLEPRQTIRHAKSSELWVYDGMSSRRAQEPAVSRVGRSTASSRSKGTSPHPQIPLALAPLFLTIVGMRLIFQIARGETT